MASRSSAAGDADITVVITHSGTDYTLPLEHGLDTSVADLRNKIYSLTNVPETAQKLIYKGRQVDDDSKPLSHYRIRNKGKIMLIGSSQAGSWLFMMVFAVDSNCRRPSPHYLVESAVSHSDAASSLGGMCLGVARCTMLDSLPLRVLARMWMELKRGFNHIWTSLPAFRRVTQRVNTRLRCLKKLKKRFLGDIEALERAMEKLDAAPITQDNSSGRAARRAAISRIEELLSQCDGAVEAIDAMGHS